MFYATSPCCDHPLLSQVDDLLRLAIAKTCNLCLTDNQWKQASLPVWSGGIGVRSVFKLASLAFLASAAGTLTLQAQILRNTLAADEDTCTSLSHWLSLSGLSASDSIPNGNQRVLDSAVVAHTYKSLLNNQNSQYHRARLLAAAAAHSGDWLNAVPIELSRLSIYTEETQSFL